MLPGKLLSILRKQVGWYLLLASSGVIILTLSTVLNSYAAPTVPVAGGGAKSAQEFLLAEPPLEGTATPTPTTTPQAQGSSLIVPAEAGLTLYLPLIFKWPQPELCISGIGASDCATSTPVTPTQTPEGNPTATGSPTVTPTQTPTKPPSPTPTPTLFFRFLPNGEFEDGHERWEEHSDKGFDVIEKESGDLPVLPSIGTDGDWAAWLGGADNEYSYIRQTVTVPRGGGGRFLVYDYYIQSYDVCGSELIPARLYDRGGLKINGQDIQGDFPGCTHELCEPKFDAGSWFTRTVILSALGIQPGDRITVEFWAITDGDRPSSLFIDNVAFTNRVDLGTPTATSFETRGPQKSPEGLNFYKSLK